ncbi:hypothetical protein [Sphingobium nicotianae]|uniref:Uncharacterized protein n=1 Tax=Sphingobium nicotianae TaxID=2782607 RepID=A0A9X1IQ79_9SPHN|nr:hypothetical protein [Sphingobium nicotianae]MBT2186421.1 hypothetical protein [Sphingobium nicotianae]
MVKALCGSVLLLAGAQAPATTYAADFGFPELYRGEWATSPKSCNGEGRGYMRINITVMGFTDAVGHLQTLKPRGTNAIEVALDYQAQGKHWPETNILTLSAKGDRLTLSGHGKTRSYMRCPSKNR